MAPVFSTSNYALKPHPLEIRPSLQPIGLSDRGLVCSASGVVEVSLLLPAPWLDYLLDDAESNGVSVAHLIRGLVAEHMAGVGERLDPECQSDAVEGRGKP
jgi:hypothetical protein